MTTYTIRGRSAFPNGREIILEVLDIIGYRDDREKFAEHFLSLCVAKAFDIACGKLPQDKKDEIEKCIRIKPDISVLFSKLYDCIDPVTMEESMRQGAVYVFNDYINTILPSLSLGTREKLGSYLEKLGRERET